MAASPTSALTDLGIHRIIRAVGKSLSSSPQLVFPRNSRIFGHISAARPDSRRRRSQSPRSCASSPPGRELAAARAQRARRAGHDWPALGRRGRARDAGAVAGVERARRRRPAAVLQAPLGAASYAKDGRAHRGAEDGGPVPPGVPVRDARAAGGDIPALPERRASVGSGQAGAGPGTGLLGAAIPGALFWAGPPACKRASEQASEQAIARASPGCFASLRSAPASWTTGCTRSGRRGRPEAAALDGIARIAGIPGLELDRVPGGDPVSAPVLAARGTTLPI